DGGTSTVANPTHTYADDGTYDVTLTVTDDDGGVGSDATTATIGAVNEVEVVIKSFKAPKKVNLSKHPFVTKKLRVVVELVGLPAGQSLDGTVYLYKVGAATPVASAPITVVAGGGGDRVTFEYAFSAADAPSVTFRAEVVAGTEEFSVRDEAFASTTVVERLRSKRAHGHRPA
ncbi:MAG: PKD domain-containing protein, partial [Acidimicrobiia bacterium]|nr:PKD domain-containing protein [Acidimicrobiia bacterium]